MRAKIIDIKKRKWNGINLWWEIRVKVNGKEILVRTFDSPFAHSGDLLTVQVAAKVRKKLESEMKRDDKKEMIKKAIGKELKV